jgi:hypothetical protein
MLGFSPRIRAEVGQQADSLLTILLILVAVVTLLVALTGPKLLKAGILIWEVLP